MARLAPFVALMILLLAGLACCTLGGLDAELLSTEEVPPPTREATGPLPTATTRPPGPPPVVTPSGPAPTPTPQIEERIAEVEWPAGMRVGDGDVVRFSLIPASEGGYLAEPEIPGHEVAPTPLPLEVERPGYTGYAIASLSGAGLQVEQAGLERQLLVPGQSNTWRWTISPPEVGTYRLVLSLAVEWDPDPESELSGPFEESVWSRVLEVEARTAFRLSGKQADWIGVAGSAVGFVAGLPFTKKALQALLQRVVRSRRGAKLVSGGGTGGA